MQACNPPDLLFLVALPLKLRGARFVFDHHDLVPELFLSRFGAGGPLLWATELLERATFRLADHVISTNESYRARRARPRPRRARAHDGRAQRARPHALRARSRPTTRSGAAGATSSATSA